MSKGWIISLDKTLCWNAQQLDSRNFTVVPYASVFLTLWIIVVYFDSSFYTRMLLCNYCTTHMKTKFKIEKIEKNFNIYEYWQAQAQECILEKSMIDSRKSSITAKVSAQIVEFNNLALKSLEPAYKEGIVPSRKYKVCYYLTLFTYLYELTFNYHEHNSIERCIVLSILKGHFFDLWIWMKLQ